MTSVRTGFVALLFALGLSAGCESGAESAHLGGSAPVEEAAAAAEGAANEVFGQAPDRALPLTSLADIVANPTRYDGETVRTEGEVARVCQRMGCWMELREDASREDGPAVRVPMANHAFFLPLDCAGRHATMQGRVAMRELSADTRAHLESEGAVATSSALFIEATGVAFD